MLLAVAVAARAMDVSSADELRQKAKQNGPKVSETFREWMLPLGTWMKVRTLQSMLFGTVVPAE